MLAAVSAQQLYYERESAQLAALDIAMQNTRRDIGLIVRSGVRRHRPRVRSSTRYALLWTRSHVLRGSCGARRRHEPSRPRRSKKLRQSKGTEKEA